MNIISISQLFSLLLSTVLSKNIPRLAAEVYQPVESTVITTHLPLNNHHYSSSGRIPSTFPPWHGVSENIIKHEESKNMGDLQTKNNFITNTRPTSTTEWAVCPCELIVNDELLKILLSTNNEEHIPNDRKLDLLRMGLQNAEQAKRCYRVCTQGHPSSLSFSTTSSNMPTYKDPNDNAIQIWTDSIDPTHLTRLRYHCYQILLPIDVTKEGRVCLQYYKPTSDSPQPSNRPKGKNVWTCCRRHFL